jgi:hypothetical protein
LGYFLRFIRLLFLFKFDAIKKRGEQINLRNTLSWLKTKIQDLLRSVAERFNSRLNEFGGETVMIRGCKEVKLHLVLGVIA